MDLGEIFHTQTELPNNFWKHLYEFMSIDEKNIHPHAWPSAWHSYISKVVQDNNVKTIVFDLKSEYFSNVFNIDENGIRSFCLYDYTRILFVERKNIARQIISGMIAEETGTWGQLADDVASWWKERLEQRYGSGHHVPKRPRQPIFIAPQNLYAAVSHAALQNKKINELLAGRIYAKIEYESLFDENGLFTDEVMELASNITGLDRSELESKPLMKKQGSQSIFDDIANADEVQAFFASTEYAWMFD